MSFLQPSPLAFHGRAFDEDVMTRSTAPGVNRPLRRTSEASSDPALISRLMRLIRDPVALAADFKEDLWDTLDLDARDEDETSAEKRKQALRAALKNASTYEDWRSWAGQLDHLEGHEAWKVERDSSEYDVELVQSRLEQLDAARAACDLDRMLFLVRTSLTRGLGDMGNVRLYRHSHIGTKALIESYINSTLETLKTILALSARASYKAMDTRHMLEQVLAARQAFGRSAMLLSGGAMLGLNHIGVLKALWENQLLPRIISGASAGSIVAAVLCTHPDEEIPAILRDFPYRELSLFDQEDGGVLRRLGRLLKVGALLDVNYLSDALRDFLGEMTFQEAYNRTRRILNICVSSASIYEIPRLLNYVTAPNVLIWSAVAASCSVPVLFGSASILTKDPKTGEAVPWNSSPLRYIDGSVDNDLPITRLAEMFNVNHFIVSQVNPHVIPFLARDDDVIATDVEHKIGDGPGWMYSAMELAKAEALHRMHVLAELGIFPNALTKARSVLSQKYSGDITIVPEISYADFPRILQNPTPDFVRQAMLTGERATWPKLSRVRNHCAVELALDDAVQQLRARVVFSPSQVDLRRMHTLPGTMTPTTSAPKVVSSKVAGTINERRRRRPASMLDEPEASGDDDGWLMVVAAPRNRSPFRLGLGQGHPSHPAASFSSLTPSNSRGRGGTVSAAAAVPPPSSQHVLQPSSDPIPSTSDLSRSPPSYSSSHVDNDDDGCDPLSASSSASSSGSPSFSYFPRASRSTGKSQAVFPNVSQPATPNIGSGRAWQMTPSALHVDRPPAAPAVSSSPSTVTAQPSPWRRTETYVPGKIAHRHASPLTATDPVNTTGSFRSAGGSSASLARSSYPAGSKSPASASASVPVPTGSSLPAKARPGSSEPRYKRIFHRTIKQQR